MIYEIVNIKKRSKEERERDSKIKIEREGNVIIKCVLGTVFHSIPIHIVCAFKIVLCVLVCGFIYDLHTVFDNNPDMCVECRCMCLPGVYSSFTHTFNGPFQQSFTHNLPPIPTYRRQ